MRCLANVESLRFRAHAQPNTVDYRLKVAVPVMAAIDGMPLAYRLLVHDLGYVDVYRGWRAGIPACDIVRSAAGNGGAFDYERYMARGR